MWFREWSGECLREYRDNRLISTAGRYGAGCVLGLEPVSLFGPRLRFFAPAHLLTRGSRAGAVKAGRCATLSHCSAALRPRLDCPEHACTLARAGRHIVHCLRLPACSVLRPSHSATDCVASRQHGAAAGGVTRMCRDAEGGSVARAEWPER